MADLDWKLAQRIAGSLQTIGHPYAESALQATAMDLMKWCKGASQNGAVAGCTPEQQALWLVEEARVTWLEGWPDKGGTAKLYALFCEKFDAKKTEVAAQLTYEELIARGVINPPCPICNERLFIGERPDMTFCLACAEGRSNARFLQEEGLRRLNGEKPAERHRTSPFLKAPLESIIDSAAKHLDDEQRRKEEQLYRLGEVGLWEAERRRKAEQLKKLEESETEGGVH